MTSAPCTAIPRSTLLIFSLGVVAARDESNVVNDVNDVSDIDELSPRRVAEVAAHLRRCGRCRHLVQRLRSSRQALRTLGLPGLLAALGSESLAFDRSTGNSTGDTSSERPGDGLVPEGVTSDETDGLDARLGVLRGRILGAARDRAWGELSRRLATLLETSRQLHSSCTGHGTGHGTGDGTGHGRWDSQCAAVLALGRRLAGLGIHVDLSDLPARRPSAPALPWVIRHLDDLLTIVGGPGRDGGHDSAEDYQPSAAPSFLDSLPPL